MRSKSIGTEVPPTKS
ncbi:DUF6053 domain-containing protein [Lysobacter enzymogenes]